MNFFLIDVYFSLLQPLAAAKPAPLEATAMSSGAGTKRPARKDDLLKELKAVEDAIARKRAKID